MEIEEIIAGLRKNDRKAQRILFFRYGKLLASVCRRYFRGSNAELEDIVQEAFIQIFKSISLYDASKGQFESWIKTISIRTAIRAYRKQKILFESLENCHPVAVDLSGYDRLVALDIHQIIDQLPDHYRQIFLMYVVDGQTHEEIAEALSLNINTSRSKLMRARKMLQQYLYQLEKVPDYENK